ncbi:Galactoside 2-alpha-L-fucosyltransferase 2 [Myotis brandtii]|uniref:L-Fucosyltransferase n=1 Tax=Myotis brandtii TaxID=109478 RepID=S7NHD2_MYOBR|nr:PREDICTED: galactoside 2-alpha-L-fucosyltransferase 2 [Myotis brandtii]EPQ15955.1 Galactoside 2-alpha-L-fucosyltransferase 2 [Myotis brandtii]
MGSWTTRPSFSTIFFFVVFVVSLIFHCHQRLALVPAPWASRGLVALGPRHLPEGGMWTINSQGRLGNQMGQYATLYALAKLNGRPASIPAQMHSALAPIFRISLPVLHGAAASRIPWRNYPLNDWMEEQYRHLPWEYVRLTGYPCSWTFYHHLRPEILREFTLHDHVREEAQRSVLADRGYLRQALDWFRARHPAPVFVVTSDDMSWCRRNIDSSLGDVVFAGNGRQGSPAKDFALLTQCNHTVFTVGTFGVWAAYLAGGDAVYLANFTLPHSRFRTIFKPQAAFLPQWVGIAANLGPAGENSP